MIKIQLEFGGKGVVVGVQKGMGWLGWVMKRNNM